MHNQYSLVAECMFESSPAKLEHNTEPTQPLFRQITNIEWRSGHMRKIAQKGFQTQSLTEAFWSSGIVDEAVAQWERSSPQMANAVAEDDVCVSRCAGVWCGRIAPARSRQTVNSESSPERTRGATGPGGGGRRSAAPRGTRPTTGFLRIFTLASGNRPVFRVLALGRAFGIGCGEMIFDEFVSKSGENFNGICYSE